jgi:hypothetical protein
MSVSEYWYAVQVVTDGEHQKADLFETLEEAKKFCRPLIKERYEYYIYKLVQVQPRLPSKPHKVTKS